MNLATRPQPAANRGSATERADTQARRVDTNGSSRRRSGAVPADVLAVVVDEEPTAVLHQETSRAPELVSLHWHDGNAQLVTREVGTGQDEVLYRVGFLENRLSVTAHGGP
jgi:hypothetical protein